MSLIKRNLFFVFLLGIAILYSVGRLYDLLSLPIFTDEAIYVRWAQIANNDASWRFISLTDGKQPLFVWLEMISMRLIHDPLLAGRLVSVAGGFASMIGIFLLGREVFKDKWVGIVAGMIYVLFPMSLVYDRMALYDSLVATFAVWALYLAVILVRRVRLDMALILGMVTGGSVLNKTSGFFNIYLLPLAVLIFDWGKKKRQERILKLLAFLILVVVLTYFYYSVLRLSPFFYIINEKNALFVYPLSQWLKHPFNFFISNMSAIINWFYLYMTWPIILTAILSFFIEKKYLREKLFLLFWGVLPMLGLGLFGKTLYPRFILFMTMPFIPLSAFFISHLYTKFKHKWIFAVIVIVIFFLSIRADYYILHDFAKAPIPVEDLNQYNNDWPSGGGVKEAVSLFGDQAQKQKIYIGTEGTFGLMPYALQIYLGKNPNIQIEGFWPISSQIPSQVAVEAHRMPTYFVFYQPCPSCLTAGFAPASWQNLSLVYQFQKPTGSRYFSVYKVNP